MLLYTSWGLVPEVFSIFNACTRNVQAQIIDCRNVSSTWCCFTQHKPSISPQESIGKLRFSRAYQLLAWALKALFGWFPRWSLWLSFAFSSSFCSSMGTALQEAATLGAALVCISFYITRGIKKNPFRNRLHGMIGKSEQLASLVGCPHQQWEISQQSGLSKQSSCLHIPAGSVGCRVSNPLCALLFIDVMAPLFSFDLYQSSVPFCIALLPSSMAGLRKTLVSSCQYTCSIEKIFFVFGLSLEIRPVLIISPELVMFFSVPCIKSYLY